MSAQTDLFGRSRRPVEGAPEGKALEPLARRLDPRLRLGTSSWSFPGWAGIVYDRPAGSTTLARHGLGAYARHPLLRTVGVDRSYYRPVDRRAWAGYAAAVPRDFRFVTKAERVLVQPEDPRFLDADYATEAVVAPVLEGVGEKAGPVLFQFPPLDPRAVGGARRFAERLYRFLEALPPEPVYAVEIRTPDLMTPDYSAALSHSGAVHGYVVHPRMLPLEEQLRRIPPDQGAEGRPSASRSGVSGADSSTVPTGGPTAPSTATPGDDPFVLRWMLREGLAYEEARGLYEPFDRLVDEDPGTRSRIGRAVRAALDAGRHAYVVVNNKAEGSSPLSVIRLAEGLAEPEGGSSNRPAPRSPE